MADHRHKRVTNARRMPRATIVAAPLAVLATASAVSLGVMTSSPPVDDTLLAEDASTDVPSEIPSTSGPSSETLTADRKARLSRGDVGRGSEVVDGVNLSEPATDKAVDAADTRLWTTAPLNIWTLPGPLAQEKGEVADGEKVLVTGREALGRVEVVLDGEARWVTAGYLSEDEPSSLGGECTNGTSVPAGVSPNIVLVHEAVCANWPEITTYGTFRSDGEHSQGLAVDIMTSGATGTEIAEFLRENYAELGINYIIWEQQIWSVERSSEGWRGMEDRGSVTANHYDHVHVTTY